MQFSCAAVDRVVLPLVTRLCECWRCAVETVTSRQRTLESMLADCRQFEQLYVDTDRWIVQTSQRCLQDEIGSDVATVKQQKDIVEVTVFCVTARMKLVGVKCHFYRVRRKFHPL